MSARRSGGGLRRAALVLAAIGAATATVPAFADEAASRKCRATIAKNVGKLIKTGLKNADACHKTADKACDGTASCNDVSDASFDPAGKYAAAKTKTTGLIGTACVGGDPVLANYPGNDATGALYPLVDQTIGDDTALVDGGQDLDCDKARVKCIETIGKNRSKIVNSIVKASTKCQAGKDKTAGTFGAIDPSCVDGGATAIAKATPSINKACTGLAPTDVGTCAPFPDCVTDGAKGAGQQLAEDIYSVSAPPPPPVCGNGAVEGTEQCDDGNTTDGDGCNHLCENELGTCTPASSPNAHRLVTVAIDTPQPLAGARVDLTYPLFEASIPGSGDSCVVRSRVNVLQSGGISVVSDDDLTRITVGLASATDFITSGALFTANFDNCVPLAVNICNRTKNVTGCSLEPKRCECVTNADCGTGGTCSTLGGVIKECTAGDPSRQSCTSDTDCALTSPGGAFLDCSDDPSGASNPPLCKPGHFPQLVDGIPPYVVGTEIGPCDGTASGPPGGCPGDNVCLDQTSATACSVTDPVDHNGSPISGVTCSVTIAEMP
jgi:cysteine-rich repeat protein